jgi:hypothetical protein
MEWNGPIFGVSRENWYKSKTRIHTNRIHVIPFYSIPFYSIPFHTKFYFDRIVFSVKF